MWDDLSSKQAKTLEFIIEYIKKNSFSPTYQEIAKNQKINIKSVAQRLNQLKRKGYIEIKKNIPRGIVLTEKSGFYSMSTVCVDIYRGIQKFKKYFKLDGLEKSVSVSPYILNIYEDSNNVFMLRVTEPDIIDSCLDFKVDKDDIIVVVRVANFTENDKVLAIYDNKLVLGIINKIEKFLAIKVRNRIIPIGGSNALVVGKVVSVIKYIE
ncbi:MAG: LexA family protein [Brevinematia bacterium]